MISDTTARLTVPVGPHDHVMGPSTAPVTLVEYGDFECPACGEAYPIVKALQQELGERIRLAFRHFPLTSIHPHAEIAAETAEAAAGEDMFWPMHDLLYENQNALDEGSLIKLADALGLDMGRFARELSEHVHARRVRDDFMSGVRSGVNGTPTFFINGTRHDGAFDYATLVDAIERQIA
jgi:protein-disulfide isomerase